MKGAISLETWERMWDFQDNCFKLFISFGLTKLDTWFLINWIEHVYYKPSTALFFWILSKIFYKLLISILDWANNVNEEILFQPAKKFYPVFENHAKLKVSS